MVHRPLCPELLSKSLAEYNYATMKATVDVLKVIQIGLTISDEQGTQPMIDPDVRRRFLILDPRRFAELLMSSSIWTSTG